MKWSKFSKVSAFARAESHLVHRTVHGGLVTTFGCILALVLFGAELQQHLMPHVEQTMTVDTAREKQLKFSFDITFPSLPCQVLSLDLVDAVGDVKTDANMASNGVIHKWRLDRHGRRVGLDEYLTPRPEGFFRTRKQSDVADMNSGVESHEGCHIYGWLDVKRVAANFHVSVHVDNYMLLAQTQKEIQRQLQQQLHDSGHGLGMIEFPNDPSIVNVSHIIKLVSFGPSYPGQLNPLDGLQRIVDHDAGTFKYYIKVVPTTYKPLRGRPIQTSQYSVTEYWTKSSRGDMSLPAIWLIYDMSPIHVRIETKRRSFLHLLVRFCAVVGGGFAMTGLLDQLVHKLVKSLSPEVHKL